MHVGLAQLGSLVLDIRGDRVDAAFVTSTGSVADHFTLAKGRRQELRRDHPALSVSTGGQQSFALDAGAAHAGEAYVIAGSFGTVPGIQVGALHVPLNADGCSNIHQDPVPGSQPYPPIFFFPAGLPLPLWLQHLPIEVWQVYPVPGF